MEIKTSELWAFLGSLVGLLTVCQTILHSMLPAPLRDLLFPLFGRFNDAFSRYSFVDIPEYDDSTLNELYTAVKLHLSATSYTTALRVKLSRAANANHFNYSPANHEPLPMKYDHAQVWWEHHTSQQQPSNSWSSSWRSMPDEKRKYILKILKKDKERILGPYMDYILKQAKEIRRKNRERLLYTNSKNDTYMHPWESVPFRHPSTFDTLALDPKRKAEIMADLQSFADGEQFYKKTGRAWKRGYLLYGPPGTGKSSLIAAMANFLQYDVYDLELTQVRCNGELRKLLLRTTNKSLIVIEDIDCSLNLTNRAKRPRREMRGELFPDKGCAPDDQHTGAMTLSGLLNFTDGLWSSCGDERIFVLTTNHVEQLDPALLRCGRMDMHILMSYCTFPAFKILAHNYLGIGDHYLLSKVEQIIDDAGVTPAEVSEILVRSRENPQTALKELLAELEMAKATKSWPAGEKESALEDVEEVKRAVEEKVLNQSNPKKQASRCRICGSRSEVLEELEELETKKTVHNDSFEKENLQEITAQSGQNAYA